MEPQFVIPASPIATKVGGGDIQVADTARGRAAASSLFADRGEFVANGFEEPVRLYEVGWRDTVAVDSGA